MSWVNAVLSGVATYFSARSQERAQQAASKDEFKWGSRLYRYQRELDEYYKQRDKAEMRRGANEFAKFSSLDRWAPGYTQTFQPNPVPAKPPSTSEAEKY